MKPLELSADEIELLLQGLEALRFMTSEVIAHDGPGATEIRAESVTHLAFVESLTAKLEAVIEQLEPADLPAGVVPAPEGTLTVAPWHVTAEKMRELTDAGVDVESYVAAENRRALDEQLAREAAVDQLERVEFSEVDLKLAVSALARAHVTGDPDARPALDRLGVTLAGALGRLQHRLAPTSSACKRERWCVRQVGHPGDCAAVFLADGSVTS